MTDSESEEDRPLFPRWTLFGIGLGNTAIAVVLHVLTGSRAAAITVASLLIVSVMAWAAHLRFRSPEPVYERAAASLTPRFREEPPEPDDHFVLVPSDHRR